MKFWPVSATAGGTTTIGAGTINVPKRELILSAVITMQDGRLKIGDLPGADLLKQELAEYRAKLTRRGYEQFEAGGRNDDLVYALALACWGWSHTGPERPETAPRARSSGRSRGVTTSPFGAGPSEPA